MLKNTFYTKGFSKEEYDYFEGKPKIRIGILSRSTVLEDIAYEFKRRKAEIYL